MSCGHSSIGFRSKRHWTKGRLVIAAGIIATCCACQSIDPLAARSTRSHVSRIASNSSRNVHSQVAATRSAGHQPLAIAPTITPQPYTPSMALPQNSPQLAIVEPTNSSPVVVADGSSQVATPTNTSNANQTVAYDSAVSGEERLAPIVNANEPSSGIGFQPANVQRTAALVNAAGLRPRRRGPCPDCSPTAPCEKCGKCDVEATERYHADDEFLCDGGDEDPKVLVAHDRSVRGLNSEDTILHFDTQDGRREVIASNKVCIYAPRFASVRKVTGIVLHEQADRAVGIDRLAKAASQDERLLVRSATQSLQAGRNQAIKGPNAFREQIGGVHIEQRTIPAGINAEFLPFENFDIIRRGQYDANEKLRLATRLQAAITWAHDLGVQVIVDEKIAHEMAGEVRNQEFVVYELPEGRARVRIVKVASTDEAHPGDLVEFTLRFDNVGDQPVKNITIIDNLTTRLEYQDDSAACSVKSKFSTQFNEGESLILRWDIEEELGVGEGGIIRFKCRVR